MNNYYLKISCFAMVAILGISFCIYNFSNWKKLDDVVLNNHIIEVNSKIDGKINELNFSENQIVKKGQILAKIDDAKYQKEHSLLDKKLTKIMKELKISKEEIEQGIKEQKNLQNEFKIAKKDLENANNDYDMYSISYKDGTVTKVDLNNAIKNLDVAQEKYKYIQEKLEKTSLNLENVKKENDLKTKDINHVLNEIEKIELLISYSSIIAQKNGKITKKNADLNKEIKQGDLLFVMLPDDYIIEANVDDISRIEIGQNVKVKINSIFKTRKGIIDKIEDKKIHIKVFDNSYNSRKVDKNNLNVWIKL